ncbi:phosphatase PAP2 family protein [Mucilaginibacter robiniae]|uniref:Phosphatase PAP2 family protein n=1 Tax=Mucilaginibacter robiniae TaxID=2728022 RepID=A0A7L5DX99_9SPHI|nr:phosphatase PAP2 family protein [Mucilaginibacter robiniae]QJD94727.1 phosphatase PAP2 family protein [Mucilaginibacter robiniae]
MKKLFYLLFCLVTFEVQAQQSSDTTKKNIPDTLKKDLFTAPDTVQHLHSKFASLIPPAALVGYGISSFYIKPLRGWDRYLYNQAAKHNIVTRSNLENYFQYAPVILTYGVNLVGVHGKNTFVDRTLIYTMSQGMMHIVLSTLKHSTHRLRPNQFNRLSFPSGHTSNAFLNAEFMSQELSGNSIIYSVIGYSFATTTGIFRIYHQDHWFSDVVAGAGFGILSTKGAYLLYPYIRNALFSDKKDKKNNGLPAELKKKKYSNSMLLPSYQDGALGLQFSMQL